MQSALRFPARLGRAFTLLEVMVSAAILVVITLMLTYAVIPMQRQAKASAANYDMDRAGSRLLDWLRRELRQSGQSEDGTTDHVTYPSRGLQHTIDTTSVANVTTSIVVFQMRTGLAAAAWSNNIAYMAVPDGTFSGVPYTIPKYRIERWSDDDGNGTFDVGELKLELARDVSAISYRRTGAQRLTLQFQFTKPNPSWGGSGAPPPFQKNFYDYVLMLNGPPN